MPEDITLERIEERLSCLDEEVTTGELSYWLTEKQRLYALGLLNHGPEKWRQAAKEAGYADGVGRTVIESGDRFLDYLAALKREVSLRLALTPESINADLQRLSKSAERHKEFGAAIRAKKLQGDIIGAFHQKEDSAIRVNANGVVIQIVNARTQEDDDAIDATWREVEALNEKGRTVPPAASLPPRSTEVPEE